MSYRSTRVFGCGLLCALAVAVFAPHAQTVVIHPDQTPPTETPDASLIAQWGNNASAVVVGSAQVLTTRHQGGGIGTRVTVDGVDYIVSELAEFGSADLRLATLRDLDGNIARFDDYATLYTSDNTVGQTVTLAGYGMGNGEATPTGVTWDSVTTNDTLRYGANHIDSANVSSFGSFSTSTLLIDFDRFSGVPGEAALAEMDSGSGWFVDTPDGWLLIGLGAYVSQFGLSAYGDVNWGIDLTVYRDQIDAAIAAQQIPEPTTVGLLGLGAVGLTRRRRTSNAI